MLYTVIQAGYILLSLICLSAIAFGLKYALRKTEPSPEKQQSIFNRFLVIISAWLILVSIISHTGFIQDFEGMPPRLFLFMVIPLGGMIWLLSRKRTARLLKAVPPQWLLYIQAFRVPVELMLWGQFVLGLTPVQMTFEGLNFDILPGLTAPVIGLLLVASKSRWAINAALVWNVICLCFLINIVAIAILSAPLPFRTFMNEPANTLVTVFPIALLPLVLVPVAYFMHALSIKQLLWLRKEKQLPKTAAAASQT